jgi:hypothetical protein
VSIATEMEAGVENETWRRKLSGKVFLINKSIVISLGSIWWKRKVLKSECQNIENFDHRTIIW